MSAERGYPKALAYQVVRYYTWDGIPEDKVKAASYIKMAVENGIDDITHLYSQILYNGEGIKPNKKEAARYFKLAADKGKANCAYYNGLMNYDGIEIPINKKEAENRKST